MIMEAFTNLLVFAYIMYESGIINKTQLKKIVDVCQKRADSSMEDIIEKLFLTLEERKKDETKSK